MKQYGYYIIYTDGMPIEEVKRMLLDQARNTLKALGAPAALERVEFLLNQPWEHTDLETVIVTRALMSAWTVAL